MSALYRQDYYFRVRRHSGTIRQGDRADRISVSRPCDQVSAYRAPNEVWGAWWKRLITTATAEVKASFRKSGGELRSGT